jgi:uncharacterized protein (TIGR02246 family)
MRYSRFALAIAVSLFAASALATDSGAAQLDAAWTKAMLANDASVLAALYAPDAVMYPPGEMEQRGREAIRKGYEEMLAAMRVLEARILPEKYETHGDTSLGWGHWTIKLCPKAGGDAISLEGRFTEVARKIGGKWYYVADHASSPLPPPPLPK